MSFMSDEPVDRFKPAHTHKAPENNDDLLVPMV
jgi:hypothetical protein